jgi:hypothetical protein
VLRMTILVPQSDKSCNHTTGCLFLSLASLWGSSWAEGRKKSCPPCKFSSTQSHCDWIICFNHAPQEEIFQIFPKMQP